MNITKKEIKKELIKDSNVLLMLIFKILYLYHQIKIK